MLIFDLREEIDRLGEEGGAFDYHGWSVAVAKYTMRVLGFSVEASDEEEGC